LRASRTESAAFIIMKVGMPTERALAAGCAVSLAEMHEQVIDERDRGKQPGAFTATPITSWPCGGAVSTT
jgi:hypothetical protein